MDEFDVRHSGGEDPTDLDHSSGEVDPHVPVKVAVQVNRARSNATADIDDAAERATARLDNRAHRPQDNISPRDAGARNDVEKGLMFGKRVVMLLFRPLDDLTCVLLHAFLKSVPFLPRNGHTHLHAPKLDVEVLSLVGLNFPLSF